MIGSLLKLLPGWPYFSRPIKTVPADAGWEQGPWFIVNRNIRLTVLALEANRLKDDILKARKQKKARKHLYAELEANTAERLRVEGGGE